SHSWITKLPMVFSSYEVAPSPDDLAGGENPNGLWLLPQSGGIVRVDTDTLTVSSAYAKGYVDAAILGDDGLPDPTSFKAYNYVGDYPNLSWRPTDGTTGLKVAANAAIGPSPFPLVKPPLDAWPGNTMDAARYFQVQTTTGTPLMVGTMQV